MFEAQGEKALDFQLWWQQQRGAVGAGVREGLPLSLKMH